MTDGTDETTGIESEYPGLTALFKRIIGADSITLTVGELVYLLFNHDVPPSSLTPNRDRWTSEEWEAIFDWYTNSKCRMTLAELADSLGKARDYVRQKKSWYDADPACRHRSEPQT